jgi:hypothetical protein
MIDRSADLNFNDTRGEWFTKNSRVADRRGAVV